MYCKWVLGFKSQQNRNYNFRVRVIPLFHSWGVSVSGQRLRNCPNNPKLKIFKIDTLNVVLCFLYFSFFPIVPVELYNRNLVLKLLIGRWTMFNLPTLSRKLSARIICVGQTTQYNVNFVFRFQIIRANHVMLIKYMNRWIWC